MMSGVRHLLRQWLSSIWVVPCEYLLTCVAVFLDNDPFSVASICGG
jgi:hypothetical protein